MMTMESVDFPIEKGCWECNSSEFKISEDEV